MAVRLSLRTIAKKEARKDKQKTKLYETEREDLFSVLVTSARQKLQVLLDRTTF